jgi:hypothetical protein
VRLFDQVEPVTWFHNTAYPDGIVARHPKILEEATKGIRSPIGEGERFHSFDRDVPKTFS